MSISTTPTFNLKAVIMETGIAADTLRAWERRYGLPMPERTPGGHRLYSQYDIEIIKWLMAKQEEGLTISRAVDLWNELTASGVDPLPAPVEVTPVIATTNLDAIREGWLAACKAYNESAAEQILNQAFAAHPLETVCVEVMQRGLQEIGEMWYRNEINAQQEHFTSALVQRRLDAMIAATPPPSRPFSVLIGCTSGDPHTFVPLLLTLLLRRRGYHVVYLGADVPILRFNEVLQVVKPHLVILSAQLLKNANGLRETAEHLRVSGSQIAYGGRIFNLLPELRNRIPAHFLGETVPGAVQMVEKLVNAEIPLEGFTSISDRDLQLARIYLQNKPMIEAQTVKEIGKQEIPIDTLSVALEQLGGNLASALSLGNLDFVSGELYWLRGLLNEHHQSFYSLEKFLEAYANSVDAIMGKSGKPVSDWLRVQIDATQAA